MKNFFDYFEKVLENSMATSEERFEQLRRVGCRATRRLPTVTGSTAAVKGWATAQRSSLRSTAHESSPASYVPRITSNAKITRKRDGEVLEEALNMSRSMKVMGVNLRVHYENSRRCVGDEPCQSHSSTSMNSFKRGVESVQAVHWVRQPDASGKGTQAHAEPLCRR